MRGLEDILLLILIKLNAERTLNGALYILQGKKSGQAIQDATLYGLEEWFGLWPTLSHDDFAQLILILKKKQLLVLSSERSYYLTEKAHLYIQELISRYPLLNIQRKRGQQVPNDELKSFWSKALLLSQMISAYLHNHREYVPLVKDHQIQEECKQIWQLYEDKKNLAREWLMDVDQLFSRLEQHELFKPTSFYQHLFLDRLPGAHHSGLNLYQLADKYKTPEAIIYACLLQVAKEWFLLGSTQKLKVLTPKQESGALAHHLTQSTLVTYQLMQQGYTLNSIAHERRLKLSTIEDHVVELVSKGVKLNLQSLISQELLQKIKAVQKKLQTKKLRYIKQSLDEEVSYLQIRLALVVGDEFDAKGSK